jgi:hypothetical protein
MEKVMKRFIAVALFAASNIANAQTITKPNVRVISQTADSAVVVASWVPVNTTEVNIIWSTGVDKTITHTSDTVHIAKRNTPILVQASLVPMSKITTKNNQTYFRIGAMAFVHTTVLPTATRTASMFEYVYAPVVGYGTNAWDCCIHF